MNVNGSLPYNSSGKCPRDTRMTQVIFPLLYTLLFFASIILNTLTGWIFFRMSSRTPFIIFLKNIVLADLTMTLTLPFKILTDSGLASWQLKAFVCRVSAVIFYNTMYISIVFLGLVSLDRYVKIVKPFGKSMMQSTAFAKALSAAVWVILFLVSFPNMILSNKEATPTSVKKCAWLKSPLGLQWHLAVSYICQTIFWAVFLSMFIFYLSMAKKVYESYAKSKSKDKRAKKEAQLRMFIIVTVFFICFAPYHFCRLPYTHSQTGQVSDCKLQNQLYIAKESTLWLSATNICLDPLIYVFVCKLFRNMLIRALKLKPAHARYEASVNTSTEMTPNITDTSL
ncbi:P2Y purinoceptor 13 [Protopterus annectens]|uniref:P2Y purinoceptor 13 n=1 Tax=Protopterus annectens TaxID=7888 RepID=UPI001CFAEC60|nr:P2Y purinoceptor 13 [Protopterus annectens]XP_043926481.1 P2Y purinoceptor 13 [Protopterus annectens]XP_043926483.1 P2Y purinoceptor 13 [Protopterus annectens]XP_043926484.1 P2Y purinoceptor 13 [Protopterus annectens]XP_043926485.1 P2Y purinoceptor 13 [Protopterus annectens]